MKRSYVAEEQQLQNKKMNTAGNTFEEEKPIPPLPSLASSQCSIEIESDDDDNKDDDPFPSIPFLTRASSSQSMVLSQEECWPGDEDSGLMPQPLEDFSGYQLVRTYAMGERQLLQLLND